MILSNVKIEKSTDCILEAIKSLRENGVIPENEKNNIRHFYYKILDTMHAD